MFWFSKNAIQCRFNATSMHAMQYNAFNGFISNQSFHVRKFKASFSNLRAACYTRIKIKNDFIPIQGDLQ